ncbi:hypothetical protein C0Q70_06345 [Pomacea canaliculata]|uniref:Beta-lactamase-related domain-containing protein n=1 Tax=Pomacea canaliculata TaxID=400727 RepID=A0A2T7PNR3_POMCA|nr:hypothetical protein C0Q70_06345 [Pomacea canaliculata]
MSTVHALLCLCSLTLFIAADCKVFTPELTSKIEEFVKKYMQAYGPVGLSLAVVKGNETWTRGFMTDKASQRPIDSSTLFALTWSTTVFTSTLLGMLMDESKSGYTWNTPVKDILGSDFQLENDYITNHTTLKDILTGRTVFTCSEEFRDVLNDNHLDVRTGREGRRGDGRSIVGGTSPPTHLSAFADELTAGFTPAEPTIGIATSAGDMAKWLSFHLREGKTADGVPLLKKKTLKETYKLQMALPHTWNFAKKPEDPVTFSVYGTGFSWLFVLLPSTTALFDTYLHTRFEIFYYIVDLLLGEDPWRNTTTFPKFSLAPDRNATNTTYTPFVVPGIVENPELFEGTYGNRLFGDVSISRNTSGELLVSYGRILGKLRKTNSTNVLLADLYGPLEFLYT